MRKLKYYLRKKRVEADVHTEIYEVYKGGEESVNENIKRTPNAQ